MNVRDGMELLCHLMRGQVSAAASCLVAFLACHDVACMQWSVLCLLLLILGVGNEHQYVR
ncbi:hypothetical protein DEDE109153_06400 [Deinococcus deserti]